MLASGFPGARSSVEKAIQIKTVHIEVCGLSQVKRTLFLEWKSQSEISQNLGKYYVHSLKHLGGRPDLDHF